MIAQAISNQALADQNWDGENAVGNFLNADNWFGNTVGGNGGFGFANGSLHFTFRNNAAQTSLFYNFAGYADTNDIFWDSSFPVGLTLDGNGQGLNFNQRLQNDSSFTQTIGSSMNLSGAKNGATQIELSPVNGDLVLNGSIFNDNSKPYVVFGNNAKTLTLNTTLGVGATPGNVSLTISANSTVKVQAIQNYTGGTNINAGVLNLGVAQGATGGPLGGTGTIASIGTIRFGSGGVGGTLQYSAVNQTDYSSRFSTGSGQTFKIDTNGQNVTFASGLTSTGGTLTKLGAGTLTIGQQLSSYSGSTTVSAGTLRILNPSGSTTPRLTATSGITVNAGGALLLNQGATTVSNNRINDAATITLGAGATVGTGGIFNTGGLNEGPAAGAAGSVASMGALTLNNNSTIDFTSANSSNLLFASLIYTAGTPVTIARWTGTLGSDSGAATNDRLLFSSTTGLSDAQLASFQFTDDAGALLGSGATQIAFNGYFELVPVPEPSTWAAGLLTVAALGYTQRRRFRTILRCGS